MGMTVLIPWLIGEAVNAIKDGNKPDLLPLSLAIVGAGILRLGLTVVRRLVELHGGRVAAHSGGLGHGSEFSVWLPVLRGHTPAPPPPRETSAPARPLRLLIVDDNRDAAESMAMLQELAGHATCVVHDGQSALAAVGEFRPDVVLLDIGLPGIDGYTVARLIRELPGGRDIFMVALTGYGSDSDRRLTEEAGFDRHMVKPADQQLLKEWLSALDAASV